MAWNIPFYPSAFENYFRFWLYEPIKIDKKNLIYQIKRQILNVLKFIPLTSEIKM